MNLEITTAFAFSIPILWAVVNLIDKYAVSYKVKKLFSFVVISGMVHIILGLSLALFLSWHGITIQDTLFPIIVGLIFGAQFYFYYLIIKKEDVSSVIGFMYVHPVFVAILSFLFLNEKLSLISYLGMLMIILGLLMLTVGDNRIRLKISFWLITPFILIDTFYEFFTKVSTTHIPELNGVAITNIFIGLIILLGLLSREIRGGVKSELKNIHWAFISESLTFLALLMTYLTMSGLPATIVSSIGAIHPMFVLLFEYLLTKTKIKISVKENIGKKILPLSLIVIGVILLYITGV